MSLRIDSTEWISGALLIGETGGGVLGSTVPSSGDNGPGYIYNDLSLPADAAKEVCGRITAWPALGTLTAFEDTSFYYVGPDGTHTFQYQLYADYMPIGAPTTVTLEVGVTHGAASAVLSTVTLSAPEATASGTLTANGVATAPVASIGLTPPAASASASAVATGAVQSISISAPSASASAGTGTVARPIADSSAGGWLPSTGSDLFAMIDEATADDADYIYATVATSCAMSLGSVSDPATSSGQVVSYRAWSPSGNGLTVTLKQGATSIASWTHATLPASATTYQQALSAAECDAISDYTALSIVMTSL